MTEQQKNIQKDLKKLMDKTRYEHTKGVMYTSACLAMNYGFDMERAMIAGLLHDCAKHISDEDQIRLCRKHHIKISESEQVSPYLLHAKLGAFFARETYGIKDTEILHAITVHTTGEKEMGLLDKILFVSDYIEPNRTKASNLHTIRTLCFSDLNKGVYQILHDTLRYLNNRRGAVDNKTKEAYDYYKKWQEENTDGIS